MGKLLAVFAHPDDETFICGGTLAKAGKVGHEVVLVCATQGEMGRRVGIPPGETRESISAVRSMELSAACNALGIHDFHFLGLRDKTLEIQPYEWMKNTVLGHLHRELPDIVLTFHPEWGGHPDHCAIGAATTAAFLDYTETVEGARLLYVCSGDMIRHPENYRLRHDQLVEIEVTECLQEKLRAFRAHRTQSLLMGWLWDDDETSASKLWSVEYVLDWQSLHQ